MVPLTTARSIAALRSDLVPDVSLDNVSYIPFASKTLTFSEEGGRAQDGAAALEQSDKRAKVVAPPVVDDVALGHVGQKNLEPLGLA